MSPSAIEQRAKQIQEEKERKEKEEQQRHESQERRHRLAEGARIQKEEKDRLDAKKKRAEKFDVLLNESAVMRPLQELERSLAHKAAKHAIVIDKDGCEVTVVWGNRFTVNDNKIGPEKTSLFLGLGEDWINEYSAFSVLFNIDNGEVEVYGRYGPQASLSKNEWKANPQRLVDALAEAYLNPFHNTTRQSEARSSYSSSDSSSNTECCHGG